MPSKTSAARLAPTSETLLEILPKRTFGTSGAERVHASEDTRVQNRIIYVDSALLVDQGCTLFPRLICLVL